MTIPEDETVTIGPVPAAVYAAMLAATIVGQLAGMLVDAVAIGHRVLWIPPAFSVVAEAFVAARYGASRIGRPLTAAESARLSGGYSVGLAAISLPLAAWMAVSKRPLLLASGLPSSHTVAVVVVIALVAFVAWTALRYLFIVFFSRSR